MYKVPPVRHRLNHLIMLAAHSFGLFELSPHFIPNAKMSEKCPYIELQRIVLLYHP